MSVQDQDVNEPVDRSVVHLETDFEPNLKGLNEPRTTNQFWKFPKEPTRLRTNFWRTDRTSNHNHFCKRFRIRECVRCDKMKHENTRTYDNKIQTTEIISNCL